MCYVRRDRTDISGGEPRTSTSTLTQLLSSDLLLLMRLLLNVHVNVIHFIRDGIAIVQCCFTSTTLWREVSLDVNIVQVQCCFTSTETIRTVRGGEPRTAASTVTQLLSSVNIVFVSVLLYDHRNHQAY